ncbi:MAG: PqqD family protein, partial [Candidatus Contendobacter sp.]
MTLPAHWLAAPLADHLVLARPGPQRGQTLRVLNPLAAWIWQSHRAGLRREDMAELLAARFQLPLAQARADIAGLLDAGQPATDAETAVSEAAQKYPAPDVAGARPGFPLLGQGGVARSAGVVGAFRRVNPPGASRHPPSIEGGNPE